jgi:hypothetical protein
MKKYQTEALSLAKKSILSRFDFRIDLKDVIIQNSELLSE